MRIRERPLPHDRPGRPSRYELRWELPPQPDGKRQFAYETFYGAKREAEARWTERQAEIHNKGYTRPTKETVEQYLQGWLRSYSPNLKATTAHSYEQVLRVHVLPTLGRLPLADLKPEHLRNLYADLLEHGRADGHGEALSPRSVRYVHAILHRALKQAVREEKIHRNVADLVDPPRAPKSAARQVTAFTLDQARAVSSAATGRRLEVLYLLAWQLGLRRGELLGLHWPQVDFMNGLLRVEWELIDVQGKLSMEQPKSRKSRRTLRMPTESVAALHRQRKAQAEEKLAAGPSYHDQGLVFATAHGTPTAPRNLNRDWYAVRVKANGPAYNFHALRHTCATLLLLAGWSLPEVSEWLGHEDYAFTKDTYGHLASEYQHRAVPMFDAFLREQGRRRPADG